MEGWEKKIIISNMDKLIQVTTCGFPLFSKLVASGILSVEDVDELYQNNRSEQAYKLYNLVTQRQNGFNILLKALRETNQSGAVAILTNGNKLKTDSIDDLRSIVFDEKLALGKGSYGTVVYKGALGNRSIAVKRVNTDQFDGNGRLVEHEIGTLQKCDAHENIVRYFGSKQEQNFVLILLELCDINLKEWVANKSIDIPAVEVLRQVTFGLKWLHEHKIVHRDLKPENILLMRNPIKVKISDFGLSRCIDDGKSAVSTSSLVSGTQGWVAPEILSQAIQGNRHRQGRFTYASDIFSLGCVYYYVLTDGKHAFGDCIRSQTNIVDGKCTIKPNDVRHGSTHNLFFVRLMISQNPKSRPSCSALLFCPIFWSGGRRARFLEDVKAHVGGAIRESQIPSVYIQCRGLKGTLEQYYSKSEDFKDTEMHMRGSAGAVNIADQPVADVNSLGVSFNKLGAHSTSTPNLANPPRLQKMDKPPQPTQSNDISKLLLNLKQLKAVAKFKRVFEIVKTEPLSTIKVVLETVAKNIKVPEIWLGDQKSLLHAAVEHREFDVVEYLVNTQGFSMVLSQVRYKDDLIHSCIADIDKVDAPKFEDKIKIMQLLFQVRPELTESRDISHRTPLHIGTKRAFKNGKKLEFIRILLENHADVNAKNYLEETPLHCVVLQKPVLPIAQLMEVVKLLLENNANPDSVNKQGSTFLHSAPRNLTPEMFHELVLHLAAVKRTKSFALKNSFGSTVLHDAVHKLEPLSETLQVFRRNGADFNSLDNNGDTLIHRGIKAGRTDLFLNALIRLGTDWKVHNKFGDSALHHASYFGNLPALKLLISLGADVNAKTLDKVTPLHAAFNKYRNTVHEIVSELLKNGADSTVLTIKGDLPIQLAMNQAKTGNTEHRTVELLKNHVLSKRENLNGTAVQGMQHQPFIFPDFRVPPPAPVPINRGQLYFTQHGMPQENYRRGTSSGDYTKNKSMGPR